MQSQTDASTDTCSHRHMQVQTRHFLQQLFVGTKQAIDTDSDSDT